MGGVRESEATLWCRVFRFRGVVCVCVSRWVLCSVLEWRAGCPGVRETACRLRPLSVFSLFPTLIRDPFALNLRTITHTRTPFLTHSNTSLLSLLSLLSSLRPLPPTLSSLLRRARRARRPSPTRRGRHPTRLPRRPQWPRGASRAGWHRGSARPRRRRWPRRRAYPHCARQTGGAEWAR